MKLDSEGVGISPSFTAHTYQLCRQWDSLWENTCNLDISCFSRTQFMGAQRPPEILRPVQRQSKAISHLEFWSAPIKDVHAGWWCSFARAQESARRERQGLLKFSANFLPRTSAQQFAQPNLHPALNARRRLSSGTYLCTNSFCSILSWGTWIHNSKLQSLLLLDQVHWIKL